MSPEVWIIWRYITRFIDERGYSPSYSEIERHCALPKGTSGYYIGVLEDHKCIQRPRDRKCSSGRNLKVLIRPEEITGHEAQS